MELPKAIKKENLINNQKLREIQIEVGKEIEREKTPEEKTAEVLKEFNEYLKKEKKMKNRR